MRKSNLRGVGGEELANIVIEELLALLLLGGDGPVCLMQ